MEWIKSHYDKAVLLLAALLGLSSAIMVILSVKALPEAFAGRDSTKPPNNTIQPPAQERLEAAAARLAQPGQWGVHEGSLLVSRPYVLTDASILVDPLEGGEPLHPPVPNAWLIQHGLDYADSSILDQDADADGFTNLEEYLAGVDPGDKTATPPYYTKLRLEKFIAIPFRLIFTSSPDEGQTFTINSKDLKSRTQFLKIGDDIKGSHFKVVRYEPKTIHENDMDKDVSELTLENTVTGDKITLVRGKEANDPTSFAEFLYLWNNSRMKVKKGDEFTLEPDTGHKYKLIDISEAGAVIQDAASGEQFKIPKLKP